MAKLYPPYIEGTLPAFCVDSNGDGVMAIPFAHNKAVSPSIDWNGRMAVKIKSVQDDVLEESLDATYNSITGEAIVNLKTSDYSWLAIQRYYKVQLAYKDNSGTIGYFSTVGVIKCTSKPTVTIVDFLPNNINNNRNEFIGKFEQGEGQDTTEKVYSSKFIITDEDGNEIATSGDILHNVENDQNSYSSSDTMLFNRDLDFGKVYKIRYIVTTNNGLVCSSPEYLLTQQESLQMQTICTPIPELNRDEGYIKISINSDNELISGMFVLAREDQSKPGYWDELTRKSFNNEKPTWIFKDYTIEQGKTYIYSIQQYNQSRIYSKREKSDPIYADFDDMFLYDGERQLKLKFNPQVSSFKTQLSETRAETIGSKYPFFFKNARIGYKVFPISALISMEGDDNAEFIKKDINILKGNYSNHRHNHTKDKDEYPNFIKGYQDNKVWTQDELVFNSTDLISKNFASERLFKLAVLDWINNGKVKLFRSPAEGNYLVRLMDVSLAPQQGLGRMLHTLNATAYESAECSRQNLETFNIIESAEENIKSQKVTITNWRSVVLNNIQASETNNLLSIGKRNITTSNIRIENVMPGSRFRIINSAIQEIIIGSTGNYYADDIEPVSAIYYLGNINSEFNNPIYGGSISYQYEVENPTTTYFDAITDTVADVGGYRECIGPSNGDLIDNISNRKYTMTLIPMSNYFKRPIEFLYYKTVPVLDEADKNIFEKKEYIDRENNTDSDKGEFRKIKSNFQFYWDLDGKIPFSDQSSMEHSPFSLYVLRNVINYNDHINDTYHVDNHLFERYYIDRYIHSQTAEDVLTNGWNNDQPEIPENVYVLDAWSGQIYNNDFQYNPTITLKERKTNNQESIDLREIEKFSLDNIDPLKYQIILGNGVYGDIFYQQMVSTFDFEKLDDEVAEKADNLNAHIELMKTTQSKYARDKELYEEYYNEYINLIDSKIAALTEPETDEDTTNNDTLSEEEG